MKKLLLTFVLAGVVSAGAAYRASAYCALAYNPVTGYIGAGWNCNTLEEAKAQALRSCPGGGIEYAGSYQGFYAVDCWRDPRNGRTSIHFQGASTLNEARRLVDQWCWGRGLTVTKRSVSWQETVGSPSAAASGVPGHGRMIHEVVKDSAGRTIMDFWGEDGPGPEPHVE